MYQNREIGLAILFFDSVARYDSKIRKCTVPVLNFTGNVIAFWILLSQKLGFIVDVYDYTITVHLYIIISVRTLPVQVPRTK